MLSNNIYRQRLLNVARALRESPSPASFTMWQYFHPCGTPACALGHYIARVDLQSAFALQMNSRGGGSLRVDEPVERHFGINEVEYATLFSASGCGGAKTTVAAAEFVEAFVEHKYPVERDPAFTQLLLDLQQHKALPDLFALPS